MQDDRIKSMLEDVEVKAPRRVWRNVAAELDAAAGIGASTSDWMKWSGMAVAFASIVVGAILFFPRSASEEIISTNNNNMALAESAPVEIVTPSEPEEIVPVAPAKKGRRLLSQNNQVDVVEIIPVPVPDESVESEEYIPSETVRENVVKEEKVEKPAASKKIEPDGSAAAAFAKMAMEDEKKFSRGVRALYAQGSIGGNDADLRLQRQVIYKKESSGSSEKKTGITELGESEYGIPLSLGVGLRYYILPRFSVGTGLNYTLLTRTFEGLYEEVESGKVVSSETGTVRHAMHYLGIPLNLYYDVISAEKIKFYVYGGGEMEYAVANNYSVPTSGSTINCSFPIDKLQWSVGAGLGVEFKLSKLLGLYLDPSVSYYFECGQPNNVRSARPLMFNFDAGLRFNF